MWTIVRKASRWLADNRPSLVSLADLSVADVRMLLLAMRLPSGHLPAGHTRALFGYSPLVSEEVRRELARHSSGTPQGARQPYPAHELRWITIAARGVVRRARIRLATHWELVQDVRARRLDHHDPADPHRYLAETLERCARTGTAAGPYGPHLAADLHLTVSEAWAFAVLLAALTGLNSSTLWALPASHTLAGSPDEPGIALVNAVKPRRGPRSAMTLPLTAVPVELGPPHGDTRRPAVVNTSLTTAFGVFTLLVQLTEPARQHLGTDRAFVYCGTEPTGRITFLDEPPKTDPRRRRDWLAEVLTGDPQRDQVLLGISLDRLRKTYLEQHRRPVAHTPATLTRYLRKMHTVTAEGFHIVREALDEQVQTALARRRMTVHPTTAQAVTAEPVGDAGRDTVLGSCADFEHSPLDGGNPCRQTFLSCLDCNNARAFPRHLPLQLVVLDELRARRTEVPVERWVTDFAGRIAQLEQIVGEFEPAQREQARHQITETHRHLAHRLFSGDLDPL